MDKVAMYKKYIYKQANAINFGGQFPSAPTGIVSGFIMDKLINVSDIRNHFDHSRLHDENGMDVFDRIIHNEDHKYDRF